jgi:hypothetical protein
MVFCSTNPVFRGTAYAAAFSSPKLTAPNATSPDLI